jgi:hypothetical protein
MESRSLAVFNEPGKKSTGVSLCLFFFLLTAQANEGAAVLGNGVHADISAPVANRAGY